MKRYDFYVVGKFKGHERKCLVQLLGTDEERAMNRWNELQAMTIEEVAKATHNDNLIGELELIKEECENCWWNDPTMVR